jgi:putative phosphoribosyl transferase
VTAPTLLLVGGLDTEVIELNQWAKIRLRCPASLTTVPGATHLLEERGTLEAVAFQAVDWFVTHLNEPPDTTKVSLDPPPRRATDQPPKAKNST